MKPHQSSTSPSSAPTSWKMDRLSTSTALKNASTLTTPSSTSSSKLILHVFRFPPISPVEPKMKLTLLVESLQISKLDHPLPIHHTPLKNSNRPLTLSTTSSK